MKRTTPWIVGDHGIRPAGPQDRCFYCHQPKGAVHLDECVIRTRTVVVRFTVELVIDEPESFTEKDINFQFNESSWCADNLADMLADNVKRTGDADFGCLCEVVSAAYVREATAEDEQAQQLFADKLPT